MSRALAAVVAAAAAAAACGHPAPPAAPVPVPVPAAPVAPVAPAPAPAPTPAPAVTLSIIGTNDLHGAISRLPLFAGYVANVRAARAADGGGVVLVDAGDMFQGTIESNLGEGADVIRAYNQLGYTAATLGNHEFDYGPVGPAATARGSGDDPRGALEARAREAKFPFVTSNVDDAATHARVTYANMPASLLVNVAGVEVGIVGASTASTPYTTMPANFRGLEIADATQRIAAEAQALRARGAQVVIVDAHIGGKCTDVRNPDDDSSCFVGEEVMPILAALPHGAVDVWVAGHTHAGMAQKIDGIAVIESYAQGRAFGRVDLRVAGGKVTAVEIHPPQLICPLDARGNPIAVADCHPGTYEGRPVVADPAVQAIADAALARAEAKKTEPLGATLTAPITRAHEEESAEGNWFCDLMLAAHPEAQIALTNGGGLRTDVPAGPLTYGRFYEAMPFDNRFATVELTGKDVRSLLATNLQRGGAFISWAGLTATARCAARGKGGVELDIRVGGKPIVDAKHYTLVTSDFLASGGDGMIGRLHLPAGSVHLGDTIIRDELAERFRAHPGQTIDPQQLVTPRRIVYPGKRPMLCGGSGAPPRGLGEPE